MHEISAKGNWSSSNNQKVWKFEKKLHRANENGFE